MNQPMSKVQAPAAAQLPLEQRIVRIIAQLATVPQGEIKQDDRLREDLGLDSVGSMELISMLAEEFDLDVPLEEAMAVTTVRGAVEMARKYLEARA
jgi:acyl carrier protein